MAAAVDWPGAVLLGIALSTVIVSFSAEDPTTGAISPAALWLLPLGALSAGCFVIRERRARHPLIAAAELRSRGAYGALLTNLAVGAALMAALLDIPVLARATVDPNSQLGAALVLLRLLVGVPIGAVAGGWLSQRIGNRVVAGAGMAITAAAFLAMTRWTATTLGDPFGPGWLHPSDPVLFACGLGFGLAIAPVNASMLASVREQMHGLASALVVVARMIGMLVGISILTAVSLHIFYTTASAFPSAQVLCPQSPLNCPAYERDVTSAIVTELRAVFLGASICAAHCRDPRGGAASRASRAAGARHPVTATVREVTPESPELEDVLESIAAAARALDVGGLPGRRVRPGPPARGSPGQGHRPRLGRHGPDAAARRCRIRLRLARP